MFGMLTNKDLKQVGDLLDEKLEQKLEQKLDEKLDEKFDEKLGKFAIILKSNFDRIENRFDSLENRFTILENKFDKLTFIVNQNHDRRIESLEDNMRIVKSRLSI
ncbi:hypothetical protein N9L18_00540 [Candidatus Pacebacteria bacterium]|nr:hypothetical protein [Candidatus Paceibacterota bacterium]